MAGPYTEVLVGCKAPPFLGKLFQNHAVFDPKLTLYTPNFGPKISIFLAFAE